MIEELKLLLGDAATNYKDDLLELVLNYTTSEIQAYTNREKLDRELETIIVRLAIIKLNRLNTEGLASISMSGVNESYIDGYPADIQAVLNRKRKIKII